MSPYQLTHIHIHTHRVSQAIDILYAVRQGRARLTTPAAELQNSVSLDLEDWREGVKANPSNHSSSSSESMVGGAAAATSASSRAA